MSGSAFDGAASTYDTDFESSPATSHIRSVVSSLLLHRLRPGDQLLEINCGTGTDAIILASKGIHVLATDASPLMIETTLEKVRLAGLENKIKTRVLAFSDLRELAGRSFRAVLSNMGGLNCVDDLHAVASDLAFMVPPGGHAVVCLMSPFCLWESMAFLAKGKPDQVFRRSRSRAAVLVHDNPVDVFFHSPSDVRDAFTPWFRHQQTLGLNIFSPPPSSRNAYRILRNWRRVLDSADDIFRGFYPFNQIGDHFVTHLVRTEVVAR